MGGLVPDNETPPDFYDLHLLALGRLTTYWARLDMEINALLQTMLKLSDDQMACVATEMPDVAARCRLIKTLGFTLDVAPEWRGALIELTHAIANNLGPKRNRFTHDYWYPSESEMFKIDKRVKISKPQSFAKPQLKHGTEEKIHVDEVDSLSVATIMASAELAKARFDLEGRTPDGPPPKIPQLTLQRVKRIVEFRLPPGA
jgi:hypothetical protein